MSINTFSSTIRQILTQLRSEPAILRRKLTDMKKKLHTQGKQDSQGVGNQPSDHEACFADVLEQHNIIYTTSLPSTLDNGFYYIYQVNGSQRSIDFQAFEINNHSKIHLINFDLKHTTSDVIVLNDGWFLNDIVYILSWMRKISAPRKKKVTEPETFIGIGQDIPTDEENEAYNSLCDIKKEINAKYKGIGHFQAYMRFANRYSCHRFTNEFSEECHHKTMDFLLKIETQMIKPTVKRKKPQVGHFPTPVNESYSSSSSLSALSSFSSLSLDDSKEST